MYFCYKINLFFIFILIVFSGNAQSFVENKMKYVTIAEVPQDRWEQLAKKKIYFGHQSVGYNIIDGIRMVMQENPAIRLRIEETRQLDEEEENGVFAHSRIGKNMDPKSKIDDFVNIVDREQGGLTDIAVPKFCYVDVNDKVVIVELFKQYQDAVESLKQKHSSLQLIHFTMPLRTQNISWKTQLKLILHKGVRELEENVKRNEYNTLLLAAYQGKDPVFDIARFEATTADGKIESFKYKGKEYLAMNSNYTSDGGHLNQIGSKTIAEKLLLFIVNEL